MLCLCWLSLTVSAEVVKIPYQQMTLNASLALAPQKSLKDGVVLITHGTLGSRQMEIIQTLQALLVEKGLNSLAINLSYQIDDRSAELLSCQVEHQHKHQDAVGEIGAWMQWLIGQGVDKVVLLGHSRGANQSAWYAVEHDADVIKGVVLVAPMLWREEDRATRYQSVYKIALAEVLARAKQEKMLSDVGFLQCPKVKISGESFLAYYEDEPRFHTPNLMQVLKKPQLLIIGSADKVTTGIESDVMPLVTSHAVQLVRVDGADHFFRDLYAEDVADAVADFVKGVLN
ncbi:alpha/beta hydrolase [Beggiatoa alba]|nr:alpha/beta hydrolase [Beggiatoa alba]